MKTNSTTRFSSRVRDYILYRPGYPEEIIQYLTDYYGLTPSSIIADIGSGTGKSTERFLQNGNRVYAVEPNADMRNAAEELLGSNPKFISTDGTAEHSNLSDRSIEFVIAGQAFHWFNIPETKKEFQRILKPGGCVVLIWNEREVNQAGFMGAYDEFLYKYSTDYKEIDHRNIDEKKIADFFSPGSFHEQHFENRQVFDFTGLKGRYDSASYAIPVGDPRYMDAIEELQNIFQKYKHDGVVVMEYVTKVFCGNFESAI